jgi:hypothetical protein
VESTSKKSVATGAHGGSNEPAEQAKRFVAQLGRTSGRSSVAERELPKLRTWVRFQNPAIAAIRDSRVAREENSVRWELGKSWENHFCRSDPVSPDMKKRRINIGEKMAWTTRLELATSAVTA